MSANGLSDLSSGNHLVQFAVDNPEFPDLSNVAGHRSFDGQLPAPASHAGRSSSCCANRQTFACRLDDARRDDLQLVDAENTVDLRQQPAQQPEIAAGDANDGGDRLLIGDAGGWQHQTDLGPVFGKELTDLLGAQLGQGYADRDVAGGGYHAPAYAR